MKYLLVIFLAISTAWPCWASEKAVTYQVDGKAFEGFFISPSPGAPLVLLIHDWDGLTGYEIKRSRMLAALGYSVFAVDLFGAEARPTSIEDKRRLTGELYQDRQRMRTLLRAGLEAAKAEGGTVQNAVAIGYCFGGAAVLELARSGADLKGFVAFHGGLDTPPGQTYAATKGKVLILHGTADESVTMEQFAKLAVELEKSGVHHEMITYSAAPHAFTVFDSDRYRKDADTKSWQRFIGFLEETLN